MCCDTSIRCSTRTEGAPQLPGLLQVLKMSQPSALPLAHLNSLTVFLQWFPFAHSKPTPWPLFTVGTFIHFFLVPDSSVLSSQSHEFPDFYWWLGIGPVLLMGLPQLWIHFLQGRMLQAPSAMSLKGEMLKVLNVIFFNSISIHQQQKEMLEIINSSDKKHKW